MADQLSNRFLHVSQSDVALIGGDGGQSRISLAMPRPENLSIMLYLLDHSYLMRLVLEVQFGYLTKSLHLFSLG